MFLSRSVGVIKNYSSLINPTQNTVGVQCGVVEMVCLRHTLALVINSRAKGAAWRGGWKKEVSARGVRRLDNDVIVMKSRGAVAIIAGGQPRRSPWRKSSRQWG